ncbi:MAG TPA: hypothetical protein VK824_11130, partial [Planctomycetota bacterium]|nr:hypothetical protein [Planctomycetota bacterium]
ALAHVVPNYYEWIDELIGGLVEAAGPAANVLVMSDHGFHAIHTDKPPGRKDRGMTGHHDGAPPGVLIAAGPDFVKLPQCDVDGFVQSGALAKLATVADIAPTLLALLGIPAAHDMVGRAVAPLLAPGPARDNAALPLVDSHDNGFRAPVAQALPAEMGESFKQRFGELGYLDGNGGQSAEPRIVVPPAATSSHSVQGVVVDAVTGRPVPRFSLTLAGSNGSVQRGEGEHPAGRFASDMSDDAPCAVTIDAAGYESETKEHIVPSSTATAPLQFRLKPKG